ncbi:MAG: hypothetical protein ACI8XM_001226 [Haloarculaceae archaeon]|jgi:hypothetical protein
MVELRLDNVANNPNLTFIFFIGLMTLAVLGLRFAFYAYRNRVETGIEMQRPIWSHLQYIGVLATLYGLAGIVEIVSTLQVPYKSGAMLGMALILALAIRQIHYTATGTNGGSDRAHPFERFARVVFVAVVFFDVVVIFVYGASPLSATIEGIAALVFGAYGLVFFHDQASHSRLQGTMLDSLLRHLLPVLTFAALINVVSIAIPAGLDRVVVLHVQVVFIIMTATALMTATIKLRQNLASL